MDVHRRTEWLCGCLRDRRAGAELRDARVRTGAPGHVRRAAGTVGARAADGHVRGLPGPAESVRDLWRDRGGRGVGRSRSRRGADPVPLLALVPVRESSDRGADRDLRAAAPGKPPRSRADWHRCTWASHRIRRAIRARLRLLQRRDPIMDRHGDDRRARRRPGAADHLRRHREPRQEPSVAVAHRAQSLTRGRVHLRTARLCGDLRRLLLSDVLHAAEPSFLAT